MGCFERIIYRLKKNIHVNPLSLILAASTFSEILVSLFLILQMTLLVTQIFAQRTPGLGPQLGREQVTVVGGRCMYSLLFLGQRQDQEFRHLMYFFRFLKKMLGRGPATLFSTNKSFCWWVHNLKSLFLKSKSDSGKCLMGVVWGDGQSSVALTLHPQHTLTVQPSGLWQPR